ncbi:hypothetical protein PCE1_003829 [Barthelona sp. PCE]
MSQEGVTSPVGTPSPAPMTTETVKQEMLDFKAAQKDVPIGSRPPSRLEPNSQQVLNRIQSELSALQKICDEEGPLVSLDYHPDFFSAGKPHPPRARRNLGDLAYVVAVCSDVSKPINIVVTNDGVYRTKDFVKFKEVGDRYGDLNSTIGEVSSDFASDPRTVKAVTNAIRRSSVVSIMSQGIPSRSSSASMKSMSPSVRKTTERINRTRSASIAKSKRLGSHHHITNLIAEDTVLSPLATIPDDEDVDTSTNFFPIDVEAKTVETESEAIIDDEIVREVEMDSDEDDGYDYDELMINLNKVHLDSIPEAHAISRLIDSMRDTTTTATIAAALSFLEEINLKSERAQVAILEFQGIDLLLNLLKAPDARSQIAICEILSEVAVYPLIQYRIAHLHGVNTIMELITNISQRCSSYEQKIRLLTAIALALGASCKNNATNRREMRQTKGMQFLIHLLHKRDPNATDFSEMDELHVKLLSASATACWNMCKNSKNREIFRKRGGVVSLCDIFAIPKLKAELMMPVAGALMQCANEPNSRRVISERDSVSHMIGYLSEDVQEEARTVSAGALFNMLHDENVRVLLRQREGLEPLVQLLQTSSNDPERMANVVGAVWQAAANEENARSLIELKAVPVLVRLLTTGRDRVKIRASAAIANIARIDAGSNAVRDGGGLPLLIKLLLSTDSAVLVNVTDALCQCSQHPESARIVSELDGMRLLWSHLKSDDHRVQANAAGAIVPLLDNPQNVSTVGRCFVGGIEMLISLLTSTHDDVLANTCAALAKVASNMENLLVITEDGVVPLLAALCNTKNNKVRQHLCASIASVCNLPTNRVVFGQIAVIPHLVEYLKCDDVKVHLTCVEAISQLAKCASNAHELHRAGAVPYLVKLIGSASTKLQEHAADAVGFMRRHHIARLESQSKNMFSKTTLQSSLARSEKIADPLMTPKP